MASWLDKKQYAVRCYGLEQVTCSRQNARYGQVNRTVRFQVSTSTQDDLRRTTHLQALHLRHELGGHPGAAEASHLLEPSPGIDAHQSGHHRDVDPP